MWKGGFLSPEIAKVVAHARADNKKLFTLLYRANDYALSLQNQLEVPPEDVQGLLIASFYSRTINSIQAAVLVVERGLPAQAKVLLRAAMESLFSLRACLDKEFAEKLVNSDAVNRKKRFKKAAQLIERNVISDPRGIVSAKKLAEIEADIAETKAVEVTTAEIAKAAGLNDWYLGVYAMFSSSVHSHVRDLERHILTDDEGYAAALINEPDLKECSGLLICSIEQLLMASVAVAAYFQVEIGDYWEKEHGALREQVEALQKKRASPEAKKCLLAAKVA